MIPATLELKSGDVKAVTVVVDRIAPAQEFGPSRPRAPEEAIAKKGKLTVLDGSPMPVGACVAWNDATAVVDENGEMVFQSRVRRYGRLSPTNFVFSFFGYCVDEEWPLDDSGRRNRQSRGGQNDESTVLDIAVRGGMAIVGRVLDMQGKPVEGIQVRSILARANRGVTDAEGRYWLNFWVGQNETAVRSMLFFSRGLSILQICQFESLATGKINELEDIILPNTRSLSLNVRYEASEQASEWRWSLGQGYTVMVDEDARVVTRFDGSQWKGERLDGISPYTVLRADLKSFEGATSEIVLKQLLNWNGDIAVGSVEDDTLEATLPKLPMSEVRIVDGEGNPLSDCRINLKFYEKEMHWSNLLNKSPVVHFREMGGIHTVTDCEGRAKIITPRHSYLVVEADPSRFHSIGPAGSGWSDWPRGAPRYFLRASNVAYSSELVVSATTPPFYAMPK